MERFILKFSNGKINQQKGINSTYYYLLSIGVVSWIIDTKKGDLMIPSKGDGVDTIPIPIYIDTGLIIPDDFQEKSLKSLVSKLELIANNLEEICIGISHRWEDFKDDEKRKELVEGLDDEITLFLQALNQLKTI